MTALIMQVSGACLIAIGLGLAFGLAFGILAVGVAVLAFGVAEELT